MAKTFIKKKSLGISLGPGYRTPDHFKASKFGASKLQKPQTKFNPSQFRIQHKGG